MANAQTAKILDVLWRQVPGGELLDLGRIYRSPLGLSRLHTTPRRILSRREVVLLSAFALVLHGTVIYWISNSPSPALPVVPPEIPPMTIEFSQPAPPIAETSPPPEPTPQSVVEPPPPIEDELALKPPQIKPIPKPKPVVKPVPKPVADTVEQKSAPLPPQQPVAATTAQPPPTPITPASASAGYLHNPAPEYPALAMRRNWEGTVLLRVHVLGTGKPSEIQIQKSSGHEQLDEAAQAAVKRWSFVPAKQGNDAIDGWVSVPIDFKIK